MSLTVVKLGGSSSVDARLFEWIKALAKGAEPLVIVPGGGPFADQVREAQVRIGFSDETAHKMAILAMDQFGLMLCDLCSRFQPAGEMNEFRQVLDAGQIPVWLPSALTIGRRDIAASWSVTSDSLAAWLAGTIGAVTLLLIKQTADFSQEDDIEALQSRGIVDASLGSMLPPEVQLRVAGSDHLTSAGLHLEQGRVPGVSIAHNNRAWSASG